MVSSPRMGAPRSRVDGDDSEVIRVLVMLEVKGRIASTTVTVSRNEILTGSTPPNQYVLALVEVSPHGAANDRLRYVHRPFDGIAEPQIGRAHV